MSCSTVFQLREDDGRVTMEGFVQWNPVYGLKISAFCNN